MMLQSGWWRLKKGRMGWKCFIILWPSRFPTLGNCLQLLDTYIAIMGLDLQIYIFKGECFGNRPMTWHHQKWQNMQSKDVAQEIFDAIRNHAECHMRSILQSDESWIVCKLQLWNQASWKKMKLINMVLELTWNWSSLELEHALHGISWISCNTQDRPVIYWADRQREAIGEADLVQNYELLKEYLYVAGHRTPLPHQLDHEALWGFVLWSTCTIKKFWKETSYQLHINDLCTWKCTVKKNEI